MVATVDVCVRGGPSCERCGRCNSRCTRGRSLPARHQRQNERRRGSRASCGSRGWYRRRRGTGCSRRRRRWSHGRHRVGACEGAVMGAIAGAEAGAADRLRREQTRAQLAADQWGQARRRRGGPSGHCCKRPARAEMAPPRAQPRAQQPAGDPLRRAGVRAHGGQDTRTRPLPGPHDLREVLSRGSRGPDRVGDPRPRTARAAPRILPETGRSRQPENPRYPGTPAGRSAHARAALRGRPSTRPEAHGTAAEAAVAVAVGAAAARGSERGSRQAGRSSWRQSRGRGTPARTPARQQGRAPAPPREAGGRGSGRRSRRRGRRRPPAGRGDARPCSHRGEQRRRRTMRSYARRHREARLAGGGAGAQTHTHTHTRTHTHTHTLTHTRAHRAPPEASHSHLPRPPHLREVLSRSLRGRGRPPGPGRAKGQ